MVSLQRGDGEEWDGGWPGEGDRGRTFNQLSTVGGAEVELQGHDVALGLV